MNECQVKSKLHIVTKEENRLNCYKMDSYKLKGRTRGYFSSILLTSTDKKYVFQKILFSYLTLLCSTQNGLREPYIYIYIFNNNHGYKMHSIGLKRNKFQKQIFSVSTDTKASLLILPSSSSSIFYSLSLCYKSEQPQGSFHFQSHYIRLKHTYGMIV